MSEAPLVWEATLDDLAEVPWDEEMFVKAIQDLTFAKSGTDG